MKRGIRIALGLIVVAVLIVTGASLYWMQIQTGTLSVSPQFSASPSSTPTSKTQTPAPSSTPVITISYHSVDLGCGRQCADITIKNEGYPSFNTNPEKFFITINNKNYTYSQTYTPTYGNWQNTTIANGATYSGTLIFNNPRTTDPFTLGYDDSTYNITYTQN